MMEVDRAKAAAEGRAAEARRFLRLLLRKHFPELGSLAQIDAISSMRWRPLSRVSSTGPAAIRSAQRF